MVLDDTTIARARGWLQGRFDAGATAVNPTALAKAEEITEAQATAIMVRAAEVSEGFEIRGNTRCPNCNESYPVTGKTLAAMAASFEAMKKRGCPNCNEVFGDELELRFTFFPQGGPAGPPTVPVGGDASEVVTDTTPAAGELAQILEEYDKLPPGANVTIINNHYHNHGSVNMGDQSNRTIHTEAGGDAIVATENSNATKGDSGSKKHSWVPIVVILISTVGTIVVGVLTFLGVLFGGE